MKTTILQNTKKDIKNFLGLKNWSVRCERIQNMIGIYDSAEIALYRTQDGGFLSRNHQKHLRIFTRARWQKASCIGVDKFGRKCNQYIFAFVNLEQRG